MLDFERSYYDERVKLIVGVDEAGRGPLAGPVCAAACVFPPDFICEEINDSKQLTAKKRETLFEYIKANALSYGIAFATPEEIDTLNIYMATQKAMKEAIAMINVDYQLILTDAMPLKGLGVDVVPIIKGDAKALNIAGASILAKVTRDHYMEQLEVEYPQFKFSLHKGYGTKLHLEELEKYGPIEGVHRKSFAPVKRFYSEQLKLF